jgi:hypothetical protein
VTAYLKASLKAAALNGLAPGRLIGEHVVEFTANQVLGAGGWDAVVELVSESVFRKLEEEKSTLKLLQKMNSKLGLVFQTPLFKRHCPILRFGISSFTQMESRMLRFAGNIQC